MLRSYDRGMNAYVVKTISYHNSNGVAEAWGPRD